MKRLIAAFITACILLSSLATFAAEPKADWLSDAHATIKRIAEDLATLQVGQSELYSLSEKTNDSLVGINNQAQHCVEETSGVLQTLRDNLNALGASGEFADNRVTQAKKDLTHNVDETSARLASCQAVLL